MPEPTEPSYQTPYDIATSMLRVYLANIHEDNRLEDEALDGIPGYREALLAAQNRVSKTGGGSLAFELIPLEPQMALVYEKFMSRRAVRQAELHSVAGAFAQLSESEIRRLLAIPAWPRTDETLEFPTISRMLALGRNRNLVVPFVERLQSDVSCPALESGSRFWRLVNNVVNRDLCRSAREAHRVLDRTTTIRALGRIGDRRATAAIEPFLRDSDEAVRKAARKALEEIGAH